MKLEIFACYMYHSFYSPVSQASNNKARYQRFKMQSRNALLMFYKHQRYSSWGRSTLLRDCSEWPLQCRADHIASGEVYLPWVWLGFVLDLAFFLLY